MTTDLYHDAETTIYHAACLCIPLIGGLTVPPNTGPDAGVTNGHCIYVHPTSSAGPNTEQLTEQTVLPIITSTNQAYGGQFVSHGVRILPKISLEGWIDTPCIESGTLGFPSSYFISQIVDTNSIRYMWPEIIIMMLEGRANQDSPDSGWGRLDPLWYRDGYGRVYNSPRILDFTGTYVEGTPQRCNYSMVLKV